MTNTKTYQLLVLLLLAGTVSCKKDKPIQHPSGDCNDLAGGGILGETYSESKRYRLPCFNPNNPNEFVYYFQDFEQGVHQLRKYDMQTAENSLLVSTGIATGPAWGRSGWITYSVSNQIFIVKDNGEDLTQFTAEPNNHYPSWNDAGDELIWEYSLVLGSADYTLRQKLTQAAPDTIYYGGLGTNDRNGNKLLSKLNINGTPYYGYYDLSVPTPFTQSNFTRISDLLGSTSGLCWAPDGESFYVTHYGEGLYNVKTNTGQITQLFDFCPSIRYEAISCSPDGRFLLGERVDGRVEVSPQNEDVSKIIESRSIYLIDLQTMKETKMNLE